jgi:hypothetical protein
METISRSALTAPDGTRPIAKAAKRVAADGDSRRLFL